MPDEQLLAHIKMSHLLGKARERRIQVGQTDYDPFKQKADRRQPAGEGGAFRDDAGKLSWHLLPMKALEPVVGVFTDGAKKYEPFNWMRGLPYTQVYDSCMRHLQAWRLGENNDPESSRPHLAHAVTNLLFLIHYAQQESDYKQRGLDLDDRIPNNHPRKSTD